MPPNVLVFYVDRFTRPTPFAVNDSWVDNTLNYSPSTPNGYCINSRHQGMVLFTVLDTVTSPKTAMNQFHATHPDVYSSDWCTHREGGSILPLPYAGWYYAATQGNSPRVLDTQTYTCAHCALVKAREILLARGSGRKPGCLTASPNHSVPDDFLGRGQIEIVGEVDILDTSTMKDYTGSPGYACGNCGRLGHNSRGCTHPAKHFDRIGIEVEGRFHERRAMIRVADNLGATYSGDGSIHESPDTEAEGYEFKTKPGSLREAIEQLVAMYPDETDDSCGMHVHMSFPQDCLTLLQTHEFYAYFRTRWLAWGTAMNLDTASPFFRRLRGNNNYCLPNEDVLRDMTSCDRYSQLNFGAYPSHKTLECRLLPMFRRSSLGVAAVQELVSIYEDFLAKPEAFGLVFPDFTDAGVHESLVQGYKFTLDPVEVELSVESRRHEQVYEIELTEITPPAENMVRIALPVNQAITVEALSTRLAALRAA